MGDDIDMKYGVPIDEEQYAFGYQLPGGFLVLRFRLCSASVDAYFQKSTIAGTRNGGLRSMKQERWGRTRQLMCNSSRD